MTRIIQTDHQRYVFLQRIMRGLMLLDLHGTDTFRARWQEAETIKSHHGGNPPPRPNNIPSTIGEKL